MNRLGPGDYLLPSNDRERLFRIRSYYEDGSLRETYPNGREKKVVGTFWSVWEYRGGTHDDFLASVARMVDFEDFEDSLRDDRLWREVSSLWTTRRAAIEDALS